ncbi:MAG: hypothetical protein KF712_17285 [Akkermansiaceae bacterium]|nr:hypothetical protein [Akkermansiaceae bacterium]
MSDPLTPMAIPDYQSEENWEAFIHLFPFEERIASPSYAEAAENLNRFMESARKTGLNAHRVKVNAADWKAWIDANNYPQSRETVGIYASYCLGKEILES